jgi:myo-inositol 2-dehydrogenase/D-chiro-inositol 1-dehydrogenase
MTLQIGVIGVGRIGKLHAENLASRLPNVKLTALADVNTREAQAVAGQLGVPLATGDYREILSSPVINAVFICSATDTHAPMIEEAVAAGKHIFCEKPIDFDLDRVKNLVKIIEQSGLKFQLGFNRRFDKNFRQLRDLLHSGNLGNPHILRITSRDPAPPPIEYIKVSGGIFLDMTIHDFDMARYLMGCEVSEVYARGAALIDPAIAAAGDIDTAVITLNFENNAICAIDNSRQASYGYDQRIEVLTSKEMIQVGNETEHRHTLYDEKGGHIARPLHFFMERYTQSYLTEARLFIESILNDTPTPVSASDGLMALAIGLAAKTSCRENRPVKLEELDL